jgi:hypothetical protein
LVKGGRLERVSEGLPAVDLAHDDLPRRQERPEQHGHRLGDRQDGLGLDTAAELLVEPFDGVGGPRRPPLLGRQAREREQAVAGLFEARGDGGALEPPFLQEGLPRVCAP